VTVHELIADLSGLGPDMKVVVAVVPSGDMYDPEYIDVLTSPEGLVARIVLDEASGP
jgi:hypothetical protein